VARTNTRDIPAILEHSNYLLYSIRGRGGWVFLTPQGGSYDEMV